MAKRSSVQAPHTAIMTPRRSIFARGGRSLSSAAVNERALSTACATSSAWAFRTRSSSSCILGSCFMQVVTPNCSACSLRPTCLTKCWFYWAYEYRCWCCVNLPNCPWGRFSLRPGCAGVFQGQGSAQTGWDRGRITRELTAQQKGRRRGSAARPGKFLRNEMTPCPGCVLNLSQRAGSLKLPVCERPVTLHWGNAGPAKQSQTRTRLRALS